MDKRIKNTLKPQDVVVLYTIQHLSCAHIGKIAGISRQGIWKILKDQGVNTSKGEGGATRVHCLCDFCGKPFEMHRTRWRNSEKHYCSNECYHTTLLNPNYHQSRQGQRIARAIINQHFRLESEHVAHHKDGDCKNNNRSNLAVYASNSDHIKATHHHNGNIKPIWDGDTPASP